MNRIEKIIPENLSFLPAVTDRQSNIAAAVLRWSLYTEFQLGVWDATTTDPTYKIIRRSGFKGKLKPNGSPENPFVQQGQKIWQTFHEEPLQEGESYKTYFRVLSSRKALATSGSEI